MFRNVLRLSAIALVLSATDAVGAEDSRPIYFKLKVPANATIEIDKYKTTSTGALRRYETPAVPVGKEYSYTVKITSGGKEVVKTIKISHTETTIDLSGDLATAGSAKPMPTPKGLKAGPAKAGFVTYEQDGRLWIFREGCKELAAFQKDGELAKHVIRPVAGPGGVTLKSPDNETIIAYLTQVDGFQTIVEDGRLWVFKNDSKELAAFKKDKELAKHVIRVAAGPMGMTVKAPDEATLTAYLKAVK